MVNLYVHLLLHENMVLIYFDSLVERVQSTVYQFRLFGWSGIDGIYYNSLTKILHNRGYYYLYPRQNMTQDHNKCGQMVAALSIVGMLIWHSGGVCSFFSIFYP